MANLFNEEKLEEMILSILSDELSYKYENAYEIERDFTKVILEEDFRDAIYELNEGLDSEVIEAAFRKVSYIDETDLVKANSLFHKYLLEGVRIDVYGEEAPSKIVKLIDFERPESNSFKAINQFTVVFKSTKRPDIIIFVNGLPLVVIELKSAVAENITIENAYLQMKTYQEEIKPLFNYNAFNIISDGINARFGSITADFDLKSLKKTL